MFVVALCLCLVLCMLLSLNAAVLAHGTDINYLRIMPCKVQIILLGVSLTIGIALAMVKALTTTSLEDSHAQATYAHWSSWPCFIPGAA